MEYIEELDGAQAQKGGLLVQFYKRNKQSKAKTREAGRPIVEEVDYVKLKAPGDRLQEVDRPVRDSDKRTHPMAWAAYQNGLSQDAVEGTPLSAWGGISPSRVEELAFFKIKTVEHLAAVSDGNLQQMGPTARRERQRAQEYLDASKSNAPLMRLQGELEEKDKRLAALEAQMARMNSPAAVAAAQFDPITGLPLPGTPHAAPKPKRIRKKKQAQAEQ